MLPLIEGVVASRGKCRPLIVFGDYPRWDGTLGKRARVVINPAPASLLEEVPPQLDQVLVMTVNPGFGGQHFLHTRLPKVRRVRHMIDTINPACDLELDGGIDPETAPFGVAAGANVISGRNGCVRRQPRSDSGQWTNCEVVWSWRRRTSKSVFQKFRNLRFVQRIG